MDPAVYVLLAIIIVTIPILVKEIKDIHKAISNTHGQCDKISERQTVVETKLDIYLDHAGFDVHKVNRVIKEHMEELKQNDNPSIGCIKVKELYRAVKEV